MVIKRYIVIVNIAGVIFACDIYNIMRIMLFFSRNNGIFNGILYQQMHTFHISAVFRTGRNYVNPRGIYAAVTENIRKFCNVLFHTVKDPCEQVTQVVREHFLWVYVGVLA